MKSLKTVQTLAKIGKIISKIIFIFCIVGFCLCAVGIVSLALGVSTLKIGGVTLESIIQNKAELTKGTLYASTALGMIFCAAEAVLSKFAEKYFANELKDGTPFTFRGAKELVRLGILTICIPVGTEIVAAIVRAILEYTLADVAKLEIGSFGSVSLGIMFIVTAQICKYGAELREQKDLPEEEK